MQTHPVTATLLSDANALALNRIGRLSSDQMRGLGETVNLAGWLLYPLGAATAVVIFLFGLLDGAMGAALHLSFEWMVVVYALLIAFFFLSAFLVANGATLAYMASGTILPAAFCLLLWWLSHNVSVVVMCGLMFGILISLGSVAHVGQGGSRDAAPAKIVAVLLGVPALLCLLLWLIATVALLAAFLLSGYWVGPLVVFVLFYGLFIWAQSDKFFKGRALRHETVVAKSGEVAWDAAKGKFVARVGNATYHALSSLPPPGLYRFYCLRSISTVVSAEPLPDVDLAIQVATSSPLEGTRDFSANSETLHDQAGRLVMLRSLMRSMKFAQSDLDANQRGRLSWRQSVKHGLPQLRELAVILYASALGGLLAGLIVAQIAPIANGFAALAHSVAVTGIAATVCLALLTALTFVLLVATRPVSARLLRIRSQEVVVIDGEVTDTRIQGITDPSWSMVLASGTGRMLPPGKRYRFYVHKATGSIVSAVPLEL